MILDNLNTTLADYGAINPKIARAIEWLKSRDLSALEPGQVITVDGDRIKAQIHSYDTQDESQGYFEVHRLFIDIQIIVSGEETIFWTPLARLPQIRTPYNFEKDIVFFEEPEWSVPLRMEAGDFAILFPSDGHKPKCKVGVPMTVRKIVVKVAV
jgi:biofilm protein TabA